MLYLLASLVLGYFLLKELWMRWHYDIHKIPAPPKLPFLGHALSFRKGNKTYALNIWMQEWRAKLGFPKVMRVCLFGRTIVLVGDNSLVRDIGLATSHGNPKDGQTYCLFQRMLMDDDPTPCMFITSTATPYVKAIRKCYAESSTSARMKTKFQKQIEVMHQGKLYLEERQYQETIDLQDFFTRLLLDVVGKVELDMDVGGLDNSSPLLGLVKQCGHHMMSLGTIPFFQLRTKLFPNSKFSKKLNKDFKDLNEQWTKMTRKVCNRGEPNEEDVTMAGNLRRVCLPGTNDPLPFNLLKGEIAFAIIAGSDTTSHQLAWIFALLATHPHVVDKLLDELEIHRLYCNNKRGLKFEDLSDLQYLTAVVKEGMRMVHAVLFVAIRTASKDLVLDGYRVPKGTPLYIPSNSSMNSEAEWEDHLAFMPERWLEDKINVKEKYYIPFGLGERECVGKKLAMQLMKVAIVYLITRFSFELVGDSIESLVQNGVSGLVFEAENGINMKITPRVKT